jgi:hypothetical protein
MKKEKVIDSLPGYEKGRRLGECRLIERGSKEEFSFDI